MNERPTSETDALREAIDNGADVEAEMTSLASKLERERDEAIRQRDETNRSSKYACDYNYEQKLKAERERDEAREDAINYYARIGELERERDELKEIVEQRILVGAEIHNKANSLIKQNDKTEAECERLRKQLTAATSALRQIHLEVGDWIRSTIIVEE